MFGAATIAAFTEREIKAEQAGASAHRASAKIGGDLQGEPIFHLPGPASALDVSVKKAVGCLPQSGKKEKLLNNIGNRAERHLPAHANKVRCGKAVR